MKLDVLLKWIFGALAGVVAYFGAMILQDIKEGIHNVQASQQLSSDKLIRIETQMTYSSSVEARQQADIDDLKIQVRSIQERIADLEKRH